MSVLSGGCNNFSQLPRKDNETASFPSPHSCYMRGPSPDIYSFWPFFPITIRIVRLDVLSDQAISLISISFLDITYLGCGMNYFNWNEDKISKSFEKKIMRAYLVVVEFKNGKSQRHPVTSEWRKFLSSSFNSAFKMRLLTELFIALFIRNYFSKALSSFLSRGCRIFLIFSDLLSAPYSICTVAVINLLPPEALLSLATLEHNRRSTAGQL